MTRRIALLRGVNVGGRNRLPMASFVSALESLGGRDVRTYIQSGNAVFTGEASAGDIATRLARDAGVHTQVFVVAATAFRKIAAANPFAREAAAAPKSVHLFLLDATPAADRVEALGRLKTPGEDFALTGTALFLHAPAGVAPSKVAAGIDRVLGMRTTARNWNTVAALLSLAEDAP